MYDVAIIGGGPSGSTTAALLRKCHPSARVVVLERERFPREHVGESQLPPIGPILDEMGCWEAVERAGFPIKVGATLRWGREEGLWDLDFIPHGALHPQPRPAPFAGQRTKTALQVDRAVYDEILLRHAEALGCEVRQGTKVAAVERDGDRITALRLGDGAEVQATWYVDASGGAGVLRRAMGVPVETPGALKNVAAWDYWEDAEWAETIGNGGTRVQVLSVPFGWVWFIPVARSRASVGLVVSAHHYKASGRTLEQLYLDAIALEPRVRTLLHRATQRGGILTTKDWSFLADRATGENWFLVGEAVGFADPILAAGMTLAQKGGKELAYTLAALLASEHDTEWLKQHYDANQRLRIRQHIRFADFWYAANGQFSDLQQECQRIATDAGLTLTAAEAWRWLAQGGFADETPGQTAVGAYDLASTKQVTQRFLGDKAQWALNRVNVLRLALHGARKTTVPYYRAGRIHAIPAFERDGKRLVIVGVVGVVVQLIEKVPLTTGLFEAVQNRLGPQLGAAAHYHAAQAVEMLLEDGWVVGTADPTRPFVHLDTPDDGPIVHAHRDAGSN